MRTSQFLTLFITFWCVGNSMAHQVTECHHLRDTDINISVVGRRNRTGQLSTQVKFEDGMGQLPNKTNFWQVDLDHKSTCASAEDRWKTQISLSQCYGAPIEKLGPPGPNYELYPGLGYYKLHNRVKIWQEAKVICQKEGAHLAIINSKQEVEVLKELHARLPRLVNDWRDEHVSVGINDIQTENTWVSIFDEPLSQTGFSEWAPGHPDGGTKYNCAVLNTITGKLHASDCSHTFDFLCERQL